MRARGVIAVPMGLIGLLFLVLAGAMPFLLVEQSKKSAHRFGKLRMVQGYIDSRLSANQSLPGDDRLRQWAQARQLDLALSVLTAPLGCLNSFGKAPHDRYIVAFWAGEWSECLSSPSGSTTPIKRLRFAQVGSLD